MTPMIWFEMWLAVLIMLPLAGVPAWLIVRGPERRRELAARAAAVRAADARTAELAGSRTRI
jgi:hypothetical protein